MREAGRMKLRRLALTVSVILTLGSVGLFFTPAGANGDDQLAGGPGRDTSDGGADTDDCNGGGNTNDSATATCETLTLVP